MLKPSRFQLLASSTVMGPAARKSRVDKAVRRLEGKDGSPAVAANRAGALPKRLKVKVVQRRRMVTEREVPVLGEAETAFHRGISEAGERFSLANVSQAFLKRYGSK
ncbi:hypothetical protein [Azohydromonas caseinilytica]|uniref:Uncharacterized protein n=1 Tax=Azohydromonas caseinilytica TaxID=2728836 RepID=A0A848FGH8_9BURK|nr:hypothetical protein [Azohydromonas caseinilytica]NML16971.1 hypothetical protein [Azohydromonas caseinilytica]